MKKTDLERLTELAQACVTRTPVIVLGSGASLAHGVPGMGALATHLRAHPPPAMTPAESVEWKRFDSLLDAEGLEAALSHAQLTDAQTDHIVQSTRTFLLPSDRAVFSALLSDRRLLPLTRLYRHLFTSVHKTIDVVTPNYDRLAEYASDAGEFASFNGFGYGYFAGRATDSHTRVFRDGQAVRTVCVWKVHGSLDWFKGAAGGAVISVPSCDEAPAGHSPVMITPGIEKYRRAFHEPFRTIVGCSDNAMEHARSFLCVGFGFNDEHLQTKLVERCESSSTPIIVVTRTLTPAAKTFLLSGRCRQFLAVEESPTGTRMYTHNDLRGTELPGQTLWKLDSFLDITIGPAT